MIAGRPWGEPVTPEQRWERWYAWYPVVVEDDSCRALCWREDVWRRRSETGGWEYRFAD